ncbi:hypothetical protein IKQ38_01025 [Candidatus Saccharibacteria bacterium]|nr:hypothetical protein [Candidatus Saccharibacteria bacterium]
MERKPRSGEQNKQEETEQDILIAGPQTEQYGNEQEVQQDSFNEGLTLIKRVTRAQYIERLRADPQRKESMRGHAMDIADTEDAFRVRLASIKEKSGEMSKKEFERWEDDYADNWRYLQQDLARMDYDNSSQEAMEYEADVEAAMFSSESHLDEAIEARSGDYYTERSRALRDAINASDEKTKQSDLSLLGSFWSSVAEHLEYRYTTQAELRDQYGDDMWSLQQFDERRTASHNDAIKHLNYLNDLARKYGTRPFTPRNFWTSQNQRQTPAMSNRMSYDRHVFESFYTHAFGKESVDRIRRKHERNSYW